MLHPLNPYHSRLNDFTVSPLSRLPDNGWVSPYLCWKITTIRCLWGSGSRIKTEWFVSCLTTTYQGYSTSNEIWRRLRIGNVEAWEGHGSTYLNLSAANNAMVLNLYNHLNILFRYFHLKRKVTREITWSTLPSPVVLTKPCRYRVMWKQLVNVLRFCTQHRAKSCTNRDNANIWH